MRIAALADVHANEAALDVVLAAVRKESPDVIVNLGDLVGYNGRPREVIAKVREYCDVVIAGNHDFGVSRRAEVAGTNSAARMVQEWTRSILDEEELAYLANLPPIDVADEFVAVHGCYLNPRHITGYVTSTMLEPNLRAVRDSDVWPSLALCGHSHVPIVGFLRRGKLFEPKWTDVFEWPADADSVLINPGAIGQPRDCDPRSSFALIDTDARTAHLCRVDYDIAAAVAANTAADLPEDLSARLWEGR